MIGIFGGTFDPPHLGHEFIIKEYWRNFPETKVLYIIPNWQSPLKEQKSTSTEHILSMVTSMLESIAANQKNNNQILDIEIKKQKISYTIDTVKSLSAQNDKINLVIGEDNLATFHLWKDYTEILNIIHRLVVFRRHEKANINLENIIQAKVFMLTNKIIEISSSAIRENVKKKIPFLNPAILNYIKINKLYA